MKIEAGCLAMIVNSHAGNDGVIVTVIKLLPLITYFDNKYGDAWEIDIELTNIAGDKSDVIGEGQLKRINDDLRKVVSWDALEGIYTPPLKEVV